MLLRAFNYENLLPWERALLRFLETLLYGGFLAGMQAALPLLSTSDPTTVPWPAVFHTFLASFVLAVVLGLRKYSGALADPPLPPLPPLPPVADSPLEGTIDTSSLPTAAAGSSSSSSSSSVSSSADGGI